MAESTHSGHKWVDRCKGPLLDIRMEICLWLVLVNIAVMYAGYYMGQGMSMEDAMKKVEQVVEGLIPQKTALKLSEEYNVNTYCRSG